MTVRSSVWWRVAVLIGCAVAGSVLACRPAWSPDGKQLLFASDMYGRTVVSVHDRSTGESRRVFVPPIGHEVVSPMWMADGLRAVILSSRKRAKTVAVSVLDVAAGKVLQAHQLQTANKYPNNVALATPAVLGRYAYVSADGIARLDLETGESRKLEPQDGEAASAVAPAGSGLCYTTWFGDRGNPGDWRWEIGELDPDTLQRTPVVASTDFPAWKVIAKPAFSPDMERLALAAEGKGQAVILVVRDGKIETELPLGAFANTSINDLAWSDDSATIYASIRRLGDNRRAAWSLYEAAFSGSVSREVKLFGSRVAAEPGFAQLGLALSPNGKEIALTTTFVEQVPLDQQGVYIVDLTERKRVAKRVPFPEVAVVKIRGSDLMIALAKQWRHAYGQQDSSRALAVGGGGSGGGIAALLAGDCDIAMTARPPRDVELQKAKKQGFELQAHPVASGEFKGNPPRVRQMFLVTKQKPSKEQQAFLDWLHSDAGHRATRQAGFQPAK